jgi:cytochrome c5
MSIGALDDAEGRLVSTHDKRFMDLFSLIIGVLVAIAVGLMVLALMVGSKTQLKALHEDPAYEAQVNERLKPFGRVALAGENVPETQAGSGSAVPAPVAAPLSGAQVFNQACNACHGGGIGGAPRFGDKADWAPRIAQGMETVRRHALLGFQGKAGVMPPKGGWVNLSDAEVNAAVDYMINGSR